MKSKTTLAALLLTFTACAQAVTIYSNTAQTGFRSSALNPSTILFDDIPVPVGVLGTNNSVSPTSITVGFRRLANAPACDVTVWTAAIGTNWQMQPGTLRNVGTVNLAANGTASVTTPITVTPTPADVPLIFSAGHGYMLVGVSNTDTTTGTPQGWRINNNLTIPGLGTWSYATGSGAINLNVFWQYNASTNLNGLYTFGFNGTNATTNPPATFYATVDGDYTTFTRRQVSGTVTLNDWTPGPTGQAVNWELLDGPGGAVLETGTTGLDASGNYTIGLLTTTGSGRVLTMKKNHWLKSGVESLDLSADVTAVDFTLLNGDVDGDNEVGPGDFSALSAAFGSMNGDTNWNALADLDGDAEVGPNDFSILTATFGESGY